ncbi:uncharacterized protein isoform X1 [Leptinotarsa decemlineata]|uniref:uncharacterized protein isoform X1 n=1 Tax=Leptinotarsa decemlineata TaxID=7539 RepID=UPI003D308B8C
MKCYVSLVCFLSVLVYVQSAPFFPGSASASLQIGGDAGGGNNAPMAGGGLGGLTNILSQIDLPGLLQGINSFVKLVGAFCPPLSQVLDNVIQNVTSTAFRVFGRAILQGGGLGGSGGGGGGGQKVSVVLPTFPPDDDDEDYEDEDDAESSSSASLVQLDGKSTISDSDTTSDSQNEAIVLRSDDETSDGSDAGVMNTEKNKKSETENIPSSLYTSPANDESNLIAKRHVRVTREVDDSDQEGAESAPVPEDLANIEEDDQDRNKRFLPFGGDGHASGGSGNFLFDIIRNTADRAARTAGTVYRMVAGTENFGKGLFAGALQSQTPDNAAAPSSPAAQLVAGSGATEESDEKGNSPGGVAEIDIQKSAGHYSEGIPGPITRLLVIANRGVANLVQDLILRLAQTSEKLVNFKARLITSLI